MTRASGAALVVGCVLAAAASVAAAATPPYDLAATQACLLALPHSVDGLPPARPPAPPALFVEALSHDAVSTWADVGPNARPHRQLGVWTGIRRYEGVVLTFFRSAADAHVSADARTRNVVWTSDQRRPTSVSLRRTVERCLRPKSATRPHGQPPPPAASLATVLNVCSNSGVWTQATFNLAAYAGQTVVLSFNDHDDGYATDPTYFLLDDVSVK